MVIMKPRLFNQESKMRLINQQLYKKAKLDLKKRRIQQQQQQQPSINISIVNNTGFEKNQRINDVIRKLELITPQEKGLHQRIYESKVGKRPANMPEFIGDIADPFDRKSSVDYSDIEPKFMGDRGERESVETQSTGTTGKQYIDNLMGMGFGRREATRMRVQDRLPDPKGKDKKAGFLMMDDSSFGSSSTGFVSESEGDLSELSGITRNRSSIFDDGGIDLT